MTATSSTIYLLGLLALTHFSVAFQLHHRTSLCSQLQRKSSSPRPTILHSENPNKPPTEEEEILPPIPTTSDSIDWDAEWKKVVDNVDQPAKRPDPYKPKSPLEINARIATNKVAKNVFDASKEMKRSVDRGVGSLPTWRSLQGDWRFWIGIIVVISFGLSILSAVGTTQANESFYI